MILNFILVLILLFLYNALVIFGGPLAARQNINTRLETLVP